MACAAALAARAGKNAYAAHRCAMLANDGSGLALSKRRVDMLVATDKEGSHIGSMLTAGYRRINVAKMNTQFI